VKSAAVVMGKPVYLGPSLFFAGLREEKREGKHKWLQSRKEGERLRKFSSEEKEDTKIDIVHISVKGRRT